MLTFVRFNRLLIADATAVAENIAPEASIHSTLNFDALKLEADKIVPLRERAMVICPALKGPDTNYTEGVEFLLLQRKPKPQKRVLPVLNTDDVYFGPGGFLG